MYFNNNKNRDTEIQKMTQLRTNPDVGTVKIATYIYE